MNKKRFLYNVIDFRCKKCKSKFTLETDKVDKEKFIIRCPKCKRKIVLKHADVYKNGKNHLGRRISSLLVGDTDEDAKKLKRKLRREKRKRLKNVS